MLVINITEANVLYRGRYFIISNVNELHLEKIFFVCLKFNTQLQGIFGIVLIVYFREKVVFFFF